MSGLHIAPNLSLPLDAVTETFAILAKRGAGKSNAAVVMAEEMFDHGLPWVAIDPKGDWWGVRAAGDGREPGLPVLVFGGLHGDVPLEPTAGQLIADVNDLPGLGDGEAYVFSPQWLVALVKIQFRRRRTFDSGATPKVGGKPRPPANLADVDLDLMEQLVEPFRDQPMYESLPVITGALSVLRDHGSAYRPGSTTNPHKAGNQGRPTTRSSAPRATSPSSRSGSAPDAGSADHREKPSPGHQRETRPATDPGEASPLGKAERLILTALAQHGARTVTQVATLTAYSSKGGGFRNALSALRSAGRIVGTGTIEITDQGLSDLGVFDPLPTGSALLDWWKAHPRIGKAESLILDALAEAYPSPLPVEEIAARTGYSSAGGGFRNALSRLRTLELATGRGELVIAEELID